MHASHDRSSARKLIHFAALLTLLVLPQTGIFVPLAPADSAPASGEATEVLHTNLTELSLNELCGVRVTSVSKKPETLMNSAAAVFVITADDIRRSGATTIPDVLRMAPGITVSRSGTSVWQVGARGFFTSGNKLLVLLDGRTVYTPLISSVQWHLPDVLLEDVERIEVIRGPGAAIWGANAVNGVINIITKNARATQGALVSGGVGTEERGFGAARIGGQAGSNTFYRFWAKEFARDVMADNGEKTALDEPGQTWYGGRTGVRVDWSDALNSAMVYGELHLTTYDVETMQYQLTPPYTEEDREQIEAAGGYVIGRLCHEFSATSDAELQVYYDRVDRQGPFLNYVMDTLDFEAKHHVLLGQRQDVVWGGGYRYMEYRYYNGIEYSLDPTSRTPDITSAFIQDAIGIVPDRFFLILGGKVEDHDVIGTEWQPTARVLFTPTPAQTYWAAVSRAVRAPSFFEQDSRAYAKVKPPGPNVGDLPTLSYVQGTRDFQSENVLAYEVGYRVQATRRLSIDLAAFFNEYTDLRTIERGETLTVADPVPHTEIPSNVDNRLGGSSHGVEAAIDWRPLDRWRLATAYTYMEDNLHLSAGSRDSRGLLSAWATPSHQVSLRSAYDLTRRVEWDVWYRYVDEISVSDVDAYSTIDTRLAWRPRRGLQLALVGQNLLESEHAEYEAEIALERSVYGQATFEF